MQFFILSSIYQHRSEYIFIYVHICVCVYIHVYVSEYVSYCTSLFSPPSTNIGLNIYPSMYIYVYVYLCIWLYVYNICVLLYSLLHLLTLVRIYIYMYVYVCIYIYYTYGDLRSLLHLPAPV